MPWHCCLLSLAVAPVPPWQVSRDCGTPTGRLSHHYHFPTWDQNSYSNLSRHSWKLAFPSKGPGVSQNHLGGYGSGLSNSPLWHWSSCNYLQPQGAISVRQYLQLGQGVFNLAVLKCRVPGFTQGPSDVVGLQRVCMCSRYPKEFLCTLGFEDRL